MIKDIEKVEEIIEYYAGERNPKEQENLVAMLREIQEVEGYIPREVQEMAAEKIGIKTTVLSCIISFLSVKIASYISTDFGAQLRNQVFSRVQEFSAVEMDKFGTASLVTRSGCKGGPEIIEAVKRELKIGKDGMSANKKVHVVTRNCLKQCKTSPNMLVDGKLYSGLTVEKALEIVRKL